MAAVETKDVRELRERTGVGMMECKRALEEAAGDMEKAVEILQKRGIAKAAKKAGRVAAEGAVHAYIHGGGRIGVLVEVNCETDFAARSDAFRALVHDLAMQIAASNPLYIDPESIPAADVERQRDIFGEQAKATGKPAAVVTKIVDGRMAKWHEEVCLINQPFIKDPDRTVRDVLGAATSSISEKIGVRRFVRYEVGEGIEKPQQKDLAEEMRSLQGK